MKANKLSLFASGNVGLEIAKFLIRNHFEDITSIVIPKEDKIISEFICQNFDNKRIFFFEKDKLVELHDFLYSVDLDYIILSWWPFILKEPFISLPKFGVVNFHPSLLPYNRGKHYNFWNIVEDVPFGVTLHFIDKGIDSGDILFQKAITKTWEDTGKTLFEKAQKAIVKLFKDNYDNLISLNYKRSKQNLSIGSFHYANEIAAASEIILDKHYEARALLNLIRARTFMPHPACYFYDNSSKYEVRINITKIDENEQ